MKSSGLNTEPWWILTLHNPLLHTKFSQSNAFSRSRKAMLRLLLAARLLLQLPDNKECTCCASAWDEDKLGLVDWHQLSDKAFHNPLQDFHDLLCQLETAVVAPFQCIPFTLVEADNETLLPFGGYLPCHREWLQLQGHRSWRLPCHLLLVLSPPLCLMGPVLCPPSAER